MSLGYVPNAFVGSIPVVVGYTSFLGNLNVEVMLLTAETSTMWPPSYKLVDKSLKYSFKELLITIYVIVIVIYMISIRIYVCIYLFIYMCHDWERAATLLVTGWGSLCMIDKNSSKPQQPYAEDLGSDHVQLVAGCQWSTSSWSVGNTGRKRARRRVDEPGTSRPLDLGLLNVNDDGD